MQTTGWPPGLLQDDSRELSRWLSTRLGARYQIQRNNMQTNRYSFNCTNGCGACGVKVVEFETSRTESIETGELIARTVEPQIVSDCCGRAVQVWDDVADDTVGRELRVED